MLTSTEWATSQSGPESGIIDGDSPSMSLSYIDKMYYKCAYTGTNDVSTESMSQLLGPCLHGMPLISTLTTALDVTHQTGSVQ